MDRGGGARQKMASLRCRRDPCGVICLILTYFSVFYADYVVIQYVLIPAYSDRSVLCVLMTCKPLKKLTWRLLLCAVSIQLATDRSDSILTLSVPSTESILNFCFLFLFHTNKHLDIFVCMFVTFLY